MPWCPNCREEYREGFSTCVDCGVELVEQLEPLEEKNKEDEYEKEVYLITVSDRIEAEIIESLLNSYEIPVLKKYREAGEFLNVYMGSTSFGVDLFIPESLLEKAKEVIKNEHPREQEEKIEEETNIMEDVNCDIKRRKGVWFIAAFFIIPLIIMIFALIIYFIKNLFKIY